MTRTPDRSGYVEVRAALNKPSVVVGGETEARYFSASSNSGITDLSNLALIEDISSDGMSLFGSQSISISDGGVYLFTYSISFVGAVVDGSANVVTRLTDGATEIPGGSAKGGTFFVAGSDDEFGTVANSVIYRMTGAGVVDWEAFPDGNVVSTHRTLTAHRIAT